MSENTVATAIVDKISNSGIAVKQNSFHLGWYAECLVCGWNSSLQGSDLFAEKAGENHVCWKKEMEEE